LLLEVEVEIGNTVGIRLTLSLGTGRWAPLYLLHIREHSYSMSLDITRVIAATEPWRRPLASESDENSNPVWESDDEEGPVCLDFSKREPKDYPSGGSISELSKDYRLWSTKEVTK